MKFKSILPYLLDGKHVRRKIWVRPIFICLVTDIDGSDHDYPYLLYNDTHNKCGGTHLDGEDLTSNDWEVCDDDEDDHECDCPFCKR